MVFPVKAAMIRLCGDGYHKSPRLAFAGINVMRMIKKKLHINVDKTREMYDFISLANFLKSVFMIT